MKRFLSYLFFFIIGVVIAYFYIQNTNSKYRTEQVHIMLNQIENVSKLVVTEATFSEMYNYQDADKYFFETVSFDKQVILSVNAKVQISYDLSKMKIETDTINKKIIIKYLPKEEVFISPQISYFDLEQSTFNQFSKEELNSISEKSIAKIKESIDASTLKEESRNRLFIELRKIYTVANILGWELVDKTQNNIIENTLKL